MTEDHQRYRDHHDHANLSGPIIVGYDCGYIKEENCQTNVDNQQCAVDDPEESHFARAKNKDKVGNA